MSLVSADSVLCFECVEIVDPVTKDGVKCLQCYTCGHSAPVEKALDDCFLFIVASAITDTLKKDYARTYRFMPFSADLQRAAEARKFMLRTGRAVIAA